MRKGKWMEAKKLTVLFCATIFFCNVTHSFGPLSKFQKEKLVQVIRNAVEFVGKATPLQKMMLRQQEIADQMLECYNVGREPNCGPTMDQLSSTHLLLATEKVEFIAAKFPEAPESLKSALVDNPFIFDYLEQEKQRLKEDFADELSAIDDLTKQELLESVSFHTKKQKLQEYEEEILEFFTLDDFKNEGDL